MDLKYKSLLLGLWGFHEFPVLKAQPALSLLLSTVVQRGL